LNITDATLTEPVVGREIQTTPGLSHLRILTILDRTGLSAWLLGLGCFFVLTIVAVIMLIVVRYPDPAMYRNSVAFTAIIGFFVVFYFASGRGWHQDIIRFMEFDQGLVNEFRVLIPGSRMVTAELAGALLCCLINLRIGNAPMGFSVFFTVSIATFYFIQYALIIFSIDIMFRQLICIMKVAQKIRIDLLNADFYSTLANILVRHVGLYIFGVCIISLSNIVFTEGTLGASEMLVAMMPWYLPGLIIISLYLIPYNHFRHRMHSFKFQELNSVASALGGNPKALDHSLLKDEASQLSKIDLLYYQDRIRAIKEWPFTDRIRALVLFGILPPLTWVIAALIEISIEGAL
jgi:hypothetical protein